METKGNATISDPKGLLELQFTCPKCGGNYFGSSQKGKSLIRHCHGINENKYCNFNFHQKDDSKYFHKRI